MLTHILILTTDGSRSKQLRRLVDSVPKDDRILIALLEQCGSSERFFDVGCRIVRLSSVDRIPLSVARNRLLDYLSHCLGPMDVGPSTRLILSDDDYWYSPEFFYVGQESTYCNTILVHPAFDPDNGRAFAAVDVRKLPNYSIIPRSKLLFYVTSIGINMPATSVLSLRFNEKIGLGCHISQGEETLFLFHALDATPETRVVSLKDAPVFHPHKMANNSRNHYSLAYFLGWCASGPYPFTSKYFRYKWMRSLAALFLRPGRLSFEIPWVLLKGYLAGRNDLEKLGSLSAPNYRF